jgi:2,4-dienoyl-CoA reductase-like NADH-dependent reductase (Old Yellow Enzyme family)
MFNPVNLNLLNLKNRFVRSATWDGMCENGFVTDKLVKLYARLSKGEIGFIITGFSHVSEYGNCNSGQMASFHDKFVPGLKKLAMEVHKYESKICAQLVHCGGQSINPVAPSETNTPFYKKIPEELTLLQIKKIQNDFANAAERFVKAGFDAIQIHAAHGYLISQFLSPVSNNRKDKYGGNIENRARFLIETYVKIRKKVGKKISVLIKINCEDFFDKGMSFEESQQVIKKLEKMGLDAVEISGGMRGAKETPVKSDINSLEKEAYWKDYSKKVKQNIKIPVILVGGLRSLSLIINLYQGKYADFFALSRPLIREPDLIKKWKNSVSNKSTCISCNKCFIPAKKGEGIKCISHIF